MAWTGVAARTSRGIAVGAAGLALLLPAFGTHGATAQIKPPAGRLFGFVQVDDHGADDGTPVVAHVNDSTCGQTSYNAVRGLFIIDLDSSIDDCSQAGNTVWFSVGACTAYTTSLVPEFSGALRADLMAPGSC